MLYIFLISIKRTPLIRTRLIMSLSRVSKRYDRDFSEEDMEDSAEEDMEDEEDIDESTKEKYEDLLEKVGNLFLLPPEVQKLIDINAPGVMDDIYRSLGDRDVSLSRGIRTYSDWYIKLRKFIPAVYYLEELDIRSFSEMVNRMPHKMLMREIVKMDVESFNITQNSSTASKKKRFIRLDALLDIIEKMGDRYRHHVDNLINECLLSGSIEMFNYISEVIEVKFGERKKHMSYIIIGGNEFLVDQYLSKSPTSNFNKAIAYAMLSGNPIVYKKILNHEKFKGKEIRADEVMRIYLLRWANETYTLQLFPSTKQYRCIKLFLESFPNQRISLDPTANIQENTAAYDLMMNAVTLGIRGVIYVVQNLILCGDVKNAYRIYVDMYSTDGNELPQGNNPFKKYNLAKIHELVFMIYDEKTMTDVNRIFDVNIDTILELILSYYGIRAFQALYYVCNFWLLERIIIMSEGKPLLRDTGIPKNTVQYNPEKEKKKYDSHIRTQIYHKETMVFYKYIPRYPLDYVMSVCKRYIEEIISPYFDILTYNLDSFNNVTYTENPNAVSNNINDIMRKYRQNNRRIEEDVEEEDIEEEYVEEENEDV